jgi:alpha-tubulin suppressor-like RCC1 family protein
LWLLYVVTEVRAGCSDLRRASSEFVASAVEQGSDYCIAVTEESEVYSWGGGGYGPLGHPKLKPPEDDDEMDDYIAARRDKVGSASSNVPVLRCCLCGVARF